MVDVALTIEEAAALGVRIVQAIESRPTSRALLERARQEVDREQVMSDLAGLTDCVVGLHELENTDSAAVVACVRRSRDRFETGLRRMASVYLVAP